MKKDNRKNLLLGAFLVVAITTFTENVVDVDLNADTLVSTEGLEANYGDLQLNVFETRRDKEKGMIYIEKPFNAKLKDPNNRGYLKAEKGNITEDGKNGDFYNAFGYIDVSSATYADYPNEKVYYGGKKIEYRDGNTLLTNGWFTTDPKIRKVENNDPKKVGYHLISETTYIEPDKQITFKNIDFYKGDTSYLPFEFPWFRQNIRPTSLVPLFPTYVSGDDDFGFATSWGTLWGNKDDKYKGGFAPKISDKQGLMVGRMEHWYKTDDFGSMKWNMNDTQVLKKKDSDVDKRYQNEFIHKYSGEYGSFDMNILSGTNNNVSALDSIIDDKKDTNFFSKGPGKGHEVKKTDRNEFINLETELKGMGKDKDINFTSKIKQVTDKDAYDLMLYDELDNANNMPGVTNGTLGGASGSSLYTNLGLYKDNDNYKVGGYYNYLKEMAPGSTGLDRSKDESYGFEVFDKRNKLHANYDKSTRDKYRALTFMEQNEDLKPQLFTNRGESLSSTLTGQYGDYTVQSIPQYDKYNSETFKFTAGEYSVGSFDSISGADVKKIENELSYLQDATRDTVQYRKSSDTSYQGRATRGRDNEYNRYENIVEERATESRGWSSLYNKDFAFTLGGGTEKSRIKDREGIYNYEYGDRDKEGKGYKKYEYESEFVDYKLEKKPFEIGSFGKIGAYAGGRYDKYSDQYVTGVDKNDLAENSTRTDLGFTHSVDLLKGKGNKLGNDFGYSHQNYNEENELFKHKENFNKFEDTVRFDTASVDGVYKVNYDMVDSASTGDKKNTVLQNSLDLDLARDQKLKLTYGTNERFTNDNEPEENKNDLSYKNYGFNYKYKQHTFDYKRQEIDYEIWKIENTDDSFEEIKMDTYTYSYDFEDRDRLTLNYINGSDTRDNYARDIKEIDTDKKMYGVSYLDYGPRYENKYSANYGRNRYNGQASYDENNANSLSYSTDTYGLGYSFLDKSMDPEFLKTYALKEFDKDEENLTTEDLDKAAYILKERQQQRKDGIQKFNLTESWKRPEAFTGDYNRKFSINGYAEKNKDKYDQTGDFVDSLEDVGFNVGYSQRRIGIGFGYSKEVNNKGAWLGRPGTEKQSSDIDDEYRVMLNMKIGKPSEGYRVTAYGKLEKDYYYDDNGPGESKNARTIGVELGKEMGYYEWSIAYYTEYDFGKRDNEWKVALQFALLTFPDMPLFGIGAKQNAGDNSKSPISSVLSGIKATDVDFDDN